MDATPAKPACFWHRHPFLASVAGSVVGAVLVAPVSCNWGRQQAIRDQLWRHRCFLVVFVRYSNQEFTAMRASLDRVLHGKNGESQEMVDRHAAALFRAWEKANRVAKALDHRLDDDWKAAYEASKAGDKRRLNELLDTLDKTHKLADQALMDAIDDALAGMAPGAIH